MESQPYRILGCIYFTDQDVENYEDAKLLTQRSLHVTSAICWNMVFIWDCPSLEAMFISNAHTEETTKETLEIFEGFLKQSK